MKDQRKLFLVAEAEQENEKSIDETLRIFSELNMKPGLLS